MTKTTVNKAIASEQPPERVFVGIPEMTPESYALEEKRYEARASENAQATKDREDDRRLAARIQSLNFAKDFTGYKPEGRGPADVIAQAKEYESYLLGS